MHSVLSLRCGPRFSVTRRRRRSLEARSIRSLMPRGNAPRDETQVGRARSQAVAPWDKRTGRPSKGSAASGGRSGATDQATLSSSPPPFAPVPLSPGSRHRASAFRHRTGAACQEWDAAATVGGGVRRCSVPSEIGLAKDGVGLNVAIACTSWLMAVASTSSVWVLPFWRYQSP
jgi:hypothetical protein